MKILIFDEASIVSLKMTVKILFNQLKFYQSTRTNVKFIFLLITVENFLAKKKKLILLELPNDSFFLHRIVLFLLRFARVRLVSTETIKK